tara:strand:+ start:698 stop:832 length:135 start_codon:yes stop_codon:yes gene_type:complete
MKTLMMVAVICSFQPNPKKHRVQKKIMGSAEEGLLILSGVSLHG